MHHELDKQNKSECNFYLAIFIKNAFQTGGGAGSLFQIVHFALKMLSLKAQQLATISEMQNGKRKGKAKAKERERERESGPKCPAMEEIKAT